MAAFFDMGGYAAFVWPAYGLAVIVMIGLALQSVADFRMQRKLARELEAGRSARPRAPMRNPDSEA
ncbi:heme exporter protein CcmD [Parvibaculum sp.]|uniref:heme exporter protein CcmD n=1 Tax=Parvibaculum sp. TaxID=2024848 RepID=UPI00320DE95E